MTFLTRDEILSAGSLATEVVEVPELKGEVMVRELTAEQRDLFQASMIEISTSGKGAEIKSVRLENATARLVALSIVDPETHESMFTFEDVELLGKQSSKALNRIYGVAQRLSALSDEDMKELVGNSDGTPSDDSSSD